MNVLGNVIENTLQIDEIKNNCVIDYDESFDYNHKKMVLLAQIINYCTLFKSNNGIIDYINSENKEEYLTKKIASLLNIKEEDILKKFSDILKYAYVNFFQEGYVFHATNSLYGNQIISGGFNQKENLEEKKDAIRINQIFSKYGENSLFKFMIFDLSNDYSGLFCNSDPLLVADYCNGPEWFRMFSGEAPIYHQLVDYRKGKGFKKKNYKDALECVEELINYYKLLDNEATEVIEFFNKYWNKYSDTSPMVIMIPTKCVFNSSIMQSAMLRSIQENNLLHIIASGKSLLYNNFCINEIIDKKYVESFSLDSIIIRNTRTKQY